MTDKERIAEALDVGMEAGYNIPTDSFMGGNSEERLRVGILAALSHFEALHGIGCHPHSPREMFPDMKLEPRLFACRNCEKIL